MVDSHGVCIWSGRSPLYACTLLAVPFTSDNPDGSRQESSESETRVGPFNRHDHCRPCVRSHCPCHRAYGGVPREVPLRNERLHNHTVIRYFPPPHYSNKKKTKELILSLDTHLGNTFPRSKFIEIVNRVNELKADVVVLTGDIIDAKISPDLMPILEPLGWLIAKYGIYYVTGNHEYLAGSAAEWVLELSNRKIHFLHNSHSEISMSPPLFPFSLFPLLLSYVYISVSSLSYLPLL